MTGMMNFRAEIICRDMFQDPEWMPKTVDSIEPYTYSTSSNNVVRSMSFYYNIGEKTQELVCIN